MEKLKTAVLGVGKLGQHHARIYGELERSELVAVVDTDEKTGSKIARNLGVPYVKNYEEIISRVEAVSIVTPTPTHYEIAKRLLEKGLHVFVEKPICRDLNQALELERISREKNLILQVGHIERYNPAVQTALHYIEEPRYIEAHRLGPYDPRVSQTDVVLDLMIHDLDIILFLVNSQVVNFDATGARILSPTLDIACAYLRFANGCYVNVISSRVTLEKFRKIRIFQKNSYISLDYAKPSLKIYKKKKEKVESLMDISRMRPRLPKIEPLKEELRDFLNAVEEKRKPLVGAQEATNALGLALRILKKIEE
ncbi:MAG TPA: Gfo/Idh/MocA family oxidoreductase [bacterium]|nr:Gfo/Idh/MocA family oxidoreductase [bacterium]